MTTITLPAVFMRGGTSKAVMFHQRDLPAERAEWDRLFLAAMGSPDPYGRQLNGMGGGISSLSKVCVIAPSARNDADVDYTFAQVQIREPRVDYRANCGNMSSAVGPFSMDEGLVRADGDAATVRIYNTNTKKLIHATFPLRDSKPRYDGDLVIPGVAGPARRCGWISLRPAVRPPASCCRPAIRWTCWMCRASARSPHRWSTRPMPGCSCVPAISA